MRCAQKRARVSVVRTPYLQSRNGCRFEDAANSPPSSGILVSCCVRSGDVGANRTYGVDLVCVRILRCAQLCSCSSWFAYKAEWKRIRHVTKYDVALQRISAICDLATCYVATAHLAIMLDALTDAIRAAPCPCVSCALLSAFAVFLASLQKCTADVGTN